MTKRRMVFIDCPMPLQSYRSELIKLLRKATAFGETHPPTINWSEGWEEWLNCYQLVLQRSRTWSGPECWLWHGSWVGPAARWCLDSGREAYDVRGAVADRLNSLLTDIAPLHVLLLEAEDTPEQALMRSIYRELGCAKLMVGSADIYSVSTVASLIATATRQESFWNPVSPHRYLLPSVRDWLMTYTGHEIDIDCPSTGPMDIVSIAHHLSLTNRFAGATSVPYSVGQHSWECSYLAPPGHELELLLHDGQEANIGDIPQPVKQWIERHAGFRVVKMLEQRLHKALAARHIPEGHQRSLSGSVVREIDARMLLTEARQFMHPLKRARWGIPPETQPYDMVLEPLPPHMVESLFLLRYIELTDPATADA